MYPQVNKTEQMPSAPPTYMESVGSQKYAYNPQQAYPSYPPQNPPPSMGSQVPTQVIVVQAPACKYIILYQVPLVILLAPSLWLSRLGIRVRNSK